MASNITLEQINKDHRIRHKVFSGCWNKSFFVEQYPMGRGWTKKPYPVQLVMDMQGQKKMGTDSYEQNSKALEEKLNEMYLYMFKKFVT